MIETQLARPTRWQRFSFAFRQFMFNMTAKSKKSSSWYADHFHIMQDDLWPIPLWKEMSLEDVVQFAERAYLDGWIIWVCLSGYKAPSLYFDRQPWEDEKNEAYKLVRELDVLRAGHSNGRSEVPLSEIRASFQTSELWRLLTLVRSIYTLRDVMVYFFIDEEGVEYFRFRPLTHV